jgi:hypothetical protein
MFGSERAQPVFLTQNLHQPFGLISPSTSVQAFGSWNNEQLLHSWSPFGESWYSTDACFIFAAACLIGNSKAAAPAAQPALCKRTIRRDSGRVGIPDLALIAASLLSTGKLNTQLVC